jgi:hypothetical protein
MKDQALVWVRVSQREAQLVIKKAMLSSQFKQGSMGWASVTLLIPICSEGERLLRGPAARGFGVFDSKGGRITPVLLPTSVLVRRASGQSTHIDRNFVHC